jgi:hypothetical protein
VKPLCVKNVNFAIRQSWRRREGIDLCKNLLYPTADMFTTFHVCSLFLSFYPYAHVAIVRHHETDAAADDFSNGAFRSAPLDLLIGP